MLHQGVLSPLRKVCNGDSCDTVLQTATPQDALEILRAMKGFDVTYATRSPCGEIFTSTIDVSLNRSSSVTGFLSCVMEMSSTAMAAMLRVIAAHSTARLSTEGVRPEHLSTVRLGRTKGPSPSRGRNSATGIRAWRSTPSFRYSCLPASDLFVAVARHQPSR